MLRYCNCRKKFDFAKAEKRPSPPGWQAKEVWHCLQCGGVSHAVAKEVTQVRGPKNAVALLHARGELNGQYTLTWRNADGSKVTTVEFRTYPRTVDVENKEPLIYSLWSLLMEKVEVILTEPNGVGDNAIEAEARQQARHEARGLSEGISLLMHPFIENADDVVRHAVKKYKNPDHEVPGLGEHLWNPLDHVRATSQKQVSSKRATPPTTLTQEQVAGIKEALASGMFTAEELAPTFNVSVASIRALVS